MPFLCTTILRDGLLRDVTVEFTAECLSPGYRATWDDPGEGPDWRCTFESAEFDGGEPDDAPGPLTDAELATLRTWFVVNHDKAYTAANDNHRDDGPDPDAARDREFDDREFWRGLEA